MRVAQIASTAVEVAGKAVDSGAGKWVSLAAIVASLVTGANNCQVEHHRHEEHLIELKKQERINHYQLGSNLTAAVESGKVKTGE